MMEPNPKIGLRLFWQMIYQVAQTSDVSRTSDVLKNCSVNQIKLFGIFLRQKKATFCQGSLFSSKFGKAFSVRLIVYRRWHREGH